MVFKVSKGGVRSGNTLRGLHSRRTKLYGRHACLIGVSSLNRRDFNSFLSKTTEEDSLVGDTLKRTNVLLSLNKQQRWRVPAMINQMMSCGSFDNSSMISLLERHKLKRKANCVRFASNWGRITNVEPKQRKYFSFSLDSIDDDQSNREKRKLRAKELKKQTRSRGIFLKRHEGPIKAVNTYTYSGHKNQKYHVEVIYPSPQSCSLTFNPKYTDVVLEEDRHGHLEVKANVKSSKRGRRHHRRHVTTKDFEDLSEETIKEDVSDMWDDCYDIDYEENFSQRHADRFSDYETNVNYLDMLLSQAEKTHKIEVHCKHQHNKGKDQNQCLNIQKSHVIYLEPDENDVVNDEITETVDSSQYLQDVKTLDFAKVILTSTQTTKEFLVGKFGSLFSEASCQPRRFMINITDDVANVLSTSTSSSKDILFISYLVFIYDGIYDDGLEVYRVIFNSHSCKSTRDLSDYISFSQTSFDDIVNSVIEYMLDVRDNEEFKFNVSSPNTNRDMNGMYRFLYNRINLQVENFNPSNALSDNTALKNVQEGNSMELDSHLNCLSSTFDQDMVCDICCDTINPTKIDAVYGTKLSKCGHHCCDTCWASHFQTRLREGLTTMACPGYNCSSEIGLLTLLSIVHISGIALLFQRKTEAEVEEVENAKWCPNSNCGLVIRIDSARNDLCHDVVCACGTEVCFACFGSAHWPAKCDQVIDYLAKSATLKPPKENAEEADIKPISVQNSKDKTLEVFEVEGRICPRCQRFINKNGGCNQMVCKCGYDFCWNCMRLYLGYSHDCKIDKQFVFEHTRLLRVHHRQHTNSMSQANKTLEGTSKRNKSKQKATLYQRALQQKLEASKPPPVGNYLVRKILSAAQKDLQFKKEIITTMERQALPQTAGEELRNFDIRPSVVHLITSSQEIKGVLHHVAEFSYVLLQDAPNSMETQRILRLADDISGICSFLSSVLGLRPRGSQDAKNAFQRLVSIQEWAKTILDALILATRRFRLQ